jgi:hypothetical protein
MTDVVKLEKELILPCNAIEMCTKFSKDASVDKGEMKMRVRC